MVGQSLQNMTNYALRCSISSWLTWKVHCRQQLRTEPRGTFDYNAQYPYDTWNLPFVESCRSHRGKLVQCLFLGGGKGWRACAPQLYFDFLPLHPTIFWLDIIYTNVLWYIYIWKIDVMWYRCIWASFHTLWLVLYWVCWEKPQVLSSWWKIGSMHVDNPMVPSHCTKYNMIMSQLITDVADTTTHSSENFAQKRKVLNEYCCSLVGTYCRLLCLVFSHIDRYGIPYML